MLVPCQWQWGQNAKLHRFVVRPALSVLAVFLVSDVLIAANDGWEDRYWEKQVDAYCQEVSLFLDAADEVILHGHNTQNYTPYCADERIQCACGTYHSAIMIDYDTMRIAFLRHDGFTNFYVYDLAPGALTAENEFVQMDALLPQSGSRLVSYYPDEDQAHRTCALELILPDGTVYSTTDTSDAYWDSAYLELNAILADYLFCVGQSHPQ